MITCPKCNATLADGSKFCEECGAPIPAPKPVMPNMEAAASAMSLGDKNVISGDIIQQKTSYNVQGNIVNETVSDETKLVKECHVCGKHVANDQGFTCPKCNRFVCEKHYNIKARLCKSCSEQENFNRWSEYQNLYYQLSQEGNGTIGIEARKQLDEAMERLGLTPQEVDGLESKLDQGLSRIEVLEVQNALKALLTGDATPNLPKIEKIDIDHEGRYEQNDVYIQMLKFLDLSKYKTNKFNGDMKMLADIELAVIDRKFYDAEQQIFFYRRCLGDLSMNKCAASSERTAIEYAYLYSVLGCEYEKTEFTQKSQEYLNEARALRETEAFKRRPEFSPNCMIVEEYWGAFIDFLEKINEAVSSGNKDFVATLSPFWKFMASPYKVLGTAAGKQTVAVAGNSLGKSDADELKSLLESWKQQVQKQQQKASLMQESLAAAASRHEEATRQQSAAAAAEEANRQARLAELAAKHDEEARLIMEIKRAQEAKAQARAEREEEKQRLAMAQLAEKAARDEERIRKAQEREAEKARRLAEKIRKKELEASVQPFMVLGEYEFTYVDRDGFEAAHKVKQVFVSDGRHFRCVEMDGFDTPKSFLLENVHELKHLGSGKTADNPLDLFRQYETTDANAFSKSTPQQRNPFEEPTAPKTLNDAAKKMLDSLGSLNPPSTETYDPTKRLVNKWLYVILAVVLGWIGVHKFYAGKKIKGAIYVIFFWTYIPMLISWIEAILAILKPADENGNIQV